MIFEPARIVGLSTHSVQLETQRKSTCDGCSANKACGVAALERFYSERKQPRHQISLPLSSMAKVGEYKVGDIVQLAINDDAIVSGSILLYGLPMIAMIIAAMLGSVLFGEAAAALTGLAGFVISLWWVRWKTRNSLAAARYLPQVLALGNLPTH